MWLLFRGKINSHVTLRVGLGYFYYVVSPLCRNINIGLILHDPHLSTTIKPAQINLDIKSI